MMRVWGGAGSACWATLPRGDTNADAGKRGEKVQRQEWATSKYKSVKGASFESSAGLKCTWNCLFNLTSGKRLFKIQMTYKTVNHTGLQEKQDLYSFDSITAHV